MSNELCKLCQNKKIIWKIFECNIEEKELCVCKTCIVLATCTRLCNRININISKASNYDFKLRPINERNI